MTSYWNPFRWWWWGGQKKEKLSQLCGPEVKCLCNERNIISYPTLVSIVKFLKENDQGALKTLKDIPDEPTKRQICRKLGKLYGFEYEPSEIDLDKLVELLRAGPGLGANPQCVSTFEALLEDRAKGQGEVQEFGRRWDKWLDKHSENLSPLKKSDWAEENKDDLFYLFGETFYDQKEQEEMDSGEE